MCGTLRTGTHGFPDPQVSAFPQTWQRLSILASGGEGEVYVLWVIPHRQLHFGPDILRTLQAHWALKKKKRCTQFDNSQRQHRTPHVMDKIDPNRWPVCLKCDIYTLLLELSRHITVVVMCAV